MKRTEPAPIRGAANRLGSMWRAASPQVALPHWIGDFDYRGSAVDGFTLSSGLELRVR